MDKNMVDWPESMVGVLTMPEDKEAVGWITFIDPKQKVRTSLPVSLGPSRAHEVVGNVWHLDVLDEHTVMTFPSIHVPDEYHSPVQVTWRVVENDDLEKECEYL